MRNHFALVFWQYLKIYIKIRCRWYQRDYSISTRGGAYENPSKAAFASLALLERELASTWDLPTDDGTGSLVNSGSMFFKSSEPR
jgi:hypothetical protein